MVHIHRRRHWGGEEKLINLISTLLAETDVFLSPAAWLAYFSKNFFPPLDTRELRPPFFP